MEQTEENVETNEEIEEVTDKNIDEKDEKNDIEQIITDTKNEKIKLTDEQRKQNIIDSKARWRERNKEAKKLDTCVVKCPCGGEYREANRYKHLNSKMHQKMLETKKIEIKSNIREKQLEDKVKEIIGRETSIKSKREPEFASESSSTNNKFNIFRAKYEEKRARTLDLFKFK